MEIELMLRLLGYQDDPMIKAVDQMIDEKNRLYYEYFKWKKSNDRPVQA